MAGNTNFPASEDVFSADTPTPTSTLTSTADSTGRKHAERHDDAEAALMAIESYGISNIPHIGSGAPTNDALVWIDVDEDAVPFAVLPPHPFLTMGA